VRSPRSSVLLTNSIILAIASISPLNPANNRLHNRWSDLLLTSIFCNLLTPKIWLSIVKFVPLSRIAADVRYQELHREILVHIGKKKLCACVPGQFYTLERSISSTEGSSCVPRNSTLSTHGILILIYVDDLLICCETKVAVHRPSNNPRTHRRW
jgi:hypothetical protein